MTEQYKDIQADDVKLAADGRVELNEKLQDLVAGGVSPEEVEEDESTVANTGCTVNVGCKPK